MTSDMINLSVPRLHALVRSGEGEQASRQGASG